LKISKKNLLGKLSGCQDSAPSGEGDVVVENIRHQGRKYRYAIWRSDNTDRQHNIVHDSDYRRTWRRSQVPDTGRGGKTICIW